jgi:hypothetical protein
MNTKFYSDLLHSFDDNKGSRIFPVIFVDMDNAEDTDVEFWLADDKDHVFDQLVSRYKDDWDMPEDENSEDFEEYAEMLEEFKERFGTSIIINDPIAEKQ